MKPLAACVGIVLWSTGCAFGDLVVSRGDEMHIWLEGAVGPEFQVVFGYEDPFGQKWADPSTIIGDDLWFDQPGFYDLSGDPEFAGFLSYASNGTTDFMRLLLFDSQSLKLVIPLGEDVVLGRFPDLTPFTVSGARLHVEGITPQADGVQLIIQMEYLGVPEPASAILAAGIACIAATRRCRVMGIEPASATTLG